MHNLEQASKIIQKQLNQHFGVKCPIPKIKVYSNPQDFFNDYTGVKKKRSLKELMLYEQDVSFYFNDGLDTICIKGFRRNGEESFERVKSQTMRMSWLLHEHIHHIQVLTGGYSKYDFADEGCCEIVTYVLTADIPHVGDYFDEITMLWNLLDSVDGSIDVKYDLI